MKLIAIESYQSCYPDPVFFRSGDLVSIGRKDDEYPGWIWITTRDGLQGWAPEQYLSINVLTKNATAKQDYSARELDTHKGDILTLHYELNSWGWVENGGNSSGWVPLHTTKPVKQTG